MRAKAAWTKRTYWAAPETFCSYVPMTRFFAHEPGPGSIHFEYVFQLWARGWGSNRGAGYLRGRTGAAAAGFGRIGIASRNACIRILCFA